LFKSFVQRMRRLYLLGLQGTQATARLEKPLSLCQRAYSNKGATHWTGPVSRIRQSRAGTGVALRPRHYSIFSRSKDGPDSPQQLMLQEELQSGYWGDIRALAKDPRAKFFSAEPKLTPKKEAVRLLDSIPASLYTYTPFSFAKVDLEEEMSKKKPTLVLVTCKWPFAKVMMDSWRNPFVDEFPHLNCYELELVQQVGYWLMGGLVRLFSSREMEPPRPAKVLYYNGIRKTKRMRWNLKIKNRLCAYAFLCDGDGLVRWRAVGLATPEELKMLSELVRKLESAGDQ
jgi:hypothetical protein